MVTRIVKMIFRDEAVEAFTALFDERKERIRACPGCSHLELWQDRKRPSVFFTFSRWDDEAALDAYRRSPFFEETWTMTRALFAERAEAWTVDAMHRLP
ncbi:MAG: antibiotic biosynthesis monooxygenase [Flaviaesturariibacter sp.]|nr:antibiotic biosynthesis monooxygenase [Flaviaesturariibacter sp.]